MRAEVGKAPSSSERADGNALSNIARAEGSAASSMENSVGSWALFRASLQSGPSRPSSSPPLLLALALALALPLVAQ